MGEMGIIGGADAPTFALLFWAILRGVLLAVAAIAAVALLALIIIHLVKKRRKHDADKKD